MGIKPLRSLTSANIFSSNNILSANLSERTQIMRYSDLLDSNQNTSLPQNIVFRSSQNINETHILRQYIQCNSADQYDNLNQYIFFLKNNTSNMDLTNLYTPFQIRQHAKGFCQQVQQAQLYYPLYQYGLTSQLQARQNRNQTFHQSQIWYLVICVLNGIRQFQRIKCVSNDFNIQSIRFNNLGCIKIANGMQSPKKLQELRNQRFYWGQRNLINYFVQQTYRFGLVLLQVCSMTPISILIQQQKQKSKQLYKMQQTFGNQNINIQYQITKSLQLIKQRYSQLLNNLINIMLCHPKDRPLPSQIYQILCPYKNDILQFKPFSFNNQTVQMIKSNLNTSNYSRRGSLVGGIGGDRYDIINNSNSNNNINSQYGSIQLQNNNRNNMYSSLNINDKNNKNSIYIRQQYTQVKHQEDQIQRQRQRQSQIQKSRNRQNKNLSVLHVNNLQPGYKNSLIYGLHNQYQSIALPTNINNMNNSNHNNNNNNNNMHNSINYSNYSILDNNNYTNNNISNNNNINIINNRYRTNTTNIQFNKNRQRSNRYVTETPNINMNMNMNDSINTNGNRNYSISNKNNNQGNVRSKTIQNTNKINNNNNNNNNINMNSTPTNAVRNKAAVSYNSQQTFNNANMNRPPRQPSNNNNSNIAQQNLMAVGRAAQSSVYNPHQQINRRNSYVANNTNINMNNPNSNTNMYNNRYQPQSQQIQNKQYQQYRPSRSPTAYLSH